MTIVNTDVPMTSQRCEEAIRLLAEMYGFRRKQLTTTAWGRPVMALVAGTGERKVLFTAAHHANEWITAPLLLRFAEELGKGGKLYGVDAHIILRNSTVHLIPMVDPDGVDLVTGAIGPGSLEYEQAAALADYYPQIPFPEGWKANLLGVDLNLQYPAGWLQAREIKFAQGYDRPGPRDFVGRAPLAQRESIALAEYTEAVDPALVLAYHTQGQVIYWQYQDLEVPGARELAEEFSKVSGYALEDVPYASGFAGYKDWFIRRFRRPGFTVEAGLGENPLPIGQFDKIYRDNIGILVTAALSLPA